jgi:hypothetical protein
MAHPLENLPSRKRLFLVLLALTILLSIVMGILGTPLNTQAASNGIVSFEFAGTPTRAQAILESWNMQAMTRAGFIQGLDFLYLCIYSTTIGLGCLMAGKILQSRRWPLAGLAASLAWALWLAAAFDAVENIALGLLLMGTVKSPWPQISWVCAAIKFGLLFSGLVYTFYGLASRLAPQDSSYAVD